MAWLAELIKGLGYWSLLGFDSYNNYLASINPLGEVNEIIRIHKRTLKRKIVSEKQLRGC